MISCLDEDPLFNPDDSENIIELFDISMIASNPSGNALPHAYVNAFDIVDEGVDINIIVSYSGAHTAPQDIQVTLEFDPILLGSYNEDNGTSYELISDDLYTLPAGGLTVTIPKGEKRANLPIKLHTADFDPNISYAFPLTIVSTTHGIVSGNFFQALYVVSAKNRYDGVYDLRFQFDLPETRPGFIYGEVLLWPGDIYLITSGANTVDFFDAWGFGNYYHPIGTISGTGVRGWSGFGSAGPKYEFDLATNIMVGVSNVWGSPAPANGRDFTFADPAVTKESSFDEETHNVYGQYVMTQPGFAPLPMTDTLIYTGPR